MFGNLGKMMKLAGEMKTKLPEMQEKLAKTNFPAEAGGGAVRATVNGRLRSVEVKIDPEALADGAMDAGMLEDLIKAAVSAAQDRAEEGIREATMELTGGMELPGLTDMI